MKASSLFVFGLVAGALAVFGVRALSLDEAEPQARHESHASAPRARVEEPHPGHDAPAAAPAAHPPEHVEAAADRPPENLICPVMGNEVDPEIWVDYEGRRIGFCCPGCDKTFLEDPAKYLKKVDAEIAGRAGADAKHSELLDPDRPPENLICPVMGNEVDPEIWVDYEGRRIGFCCPGCDKTFLEDPAKYLKKVDAELRARSER